MLVQDLELPTEFGPLIAHSMREQIDDYLKTIAHGTDNKRRRVNPDDLVRDDIEAGEWNPKVQQLDEQEVEKFDQSLEREQRYVMMVYCHLSGRALNIWLDWEEGKQSLWQRNPDPDDQLIVTITIHDLN